MGNSENIIAIKNLSVDYKGHVALKNISFNIPKKKITVIIGPSGCGKSTLLRSLNRLVDSVDSAYVKGKILIDGENILDPQVDVIRIRKKVGLLSQRPYPLPMSIYDNVAYGPRIYGMKGKRALDKIVKHYLKEASLWEEVKNRLHTPAANLSLGQQQRLCLARGLAVEPEIILGDEPTSSLDPISAIQIEKRFLELKNDYTLVVVTHILRQAKRIADYVAFLYLGELIECGPAKKVFTNPRHAKTRAYLEGEIS